MLRVMHLRQRLPSACIVAPVGQARRSKIEGGWNLAFECIPGGRDVRRPEDGAIALRPQVSIAREHQGAMLGVSAEAIIDSSRVKERINIEILCAGTNVQVAAIWRQVGFGFIGPNGVEAFAENIFPDALPIPMGRVRIRGVYVRASFIVRQAVGWSAIRHMLKPS